MLRGAQLYEKLLLNGMIRPDFGNQTFTEEPIEAFLYTLVEQEQNNLFLFNQRKEKLEDIPKMPSVQYLTPKDSGRHSKRGQQEGRYKSAVNFGKQRLSDWHHQHKDSGSESEKHSNKRKNAAKIPSRHNVVKIKGKQTGESESED